MSKPESSSRDSRSQPLLTIQIHRGAAVFILALVVISLGAFLVARALNRGHEETPRQQAAAEEKPAMVAAVPNTTPQDSGWQKAWRKDTKNSLPPAAEQTDPSDSQNFDDSSTQQPPEEPAPQPVPAVYVVPQP